MRRVGNWGKEETRDRTREDRVPSLTQTNTCHRRDLSFVLLDIFFNLVPQNRSVGDRCRTSFWCLVGRIYKTGWTLRPVVTPRTWMVERFRMFGRTRGHFVFVINGTHLSERSSERDSKVSTYQGILCKTGIIFSFRFGYLVPQCSPYETCEEI